MPSAPPRPRVPCCVLLLLAIRRLDGLAFRPRERCCFCASICVHVGVISAEYIPGGRIAGPARRPCSPGSASSACVRPDGGCPAASPAELPPLQAAPRDGAAPGAHGARRTPPGWRYAGRSRGPLVAVAAEIQQGFSSFLSVFVAVTSSLDVPTVPESQPSKRPGPCTHSRPASRGPPLCSSPPAPLSAPPRKPGWPAGLADLSVAPAPLRSSCFFLGPLF